MWDGNGHGTHCAGVITGRRWGVAKQAKVRAIKVLSDEGGGATRYFFFYFSFGHFSGASFFFFKKKQPNS